MSFRGFLDNARREASSMAQGVFPAAQAIGQQTVNDLDTAVFEKGLGLKARKKKPGAGSFGLDELGKTAAVGWANDTPILPLLKGNFGEAAHRLYERPISGTMDFIGAGSLGGQGLKLSSKIPGSFGESSLRLRGYQQLDPTSLGYGQTIGQLPAKINLIDGTQVPGREYLMRPQIATHGDNIWAKKTMRSAKPSGDKVFDEAVDTAETLADDPLTLQATPRARYEPFAKIGDMMHFGPTLGSARFGRRLTIRNQSRLKTSVNEMMGLHGVMKKQYEKAFGKDSAPVVGDALAVHAAGFKSAADLDELPKAFEPSGRKAILSDKGVDLQSKSGNVVELNNAEYRLADMTVKQRDLMLEELAKDIEKLNESGHSVVLTGGEVDRVLTPAQVRAGGDKLAYALPNRNLFIKKGGVPSTPEGGSSTKPRRGTDDEVAAAREEAFGGPTSQPFETPGIPKPDQVDEVGRMRALKKIENEDIPELGYDQADVNDFAENFDTGDEEAFANWTDEQPLGDDAPAAWQKKLRAKTAENYGQMTWYKDYLDQLVKARVNDGPDITYRFKAIAQNPKVREILDSDVFKNEILPKHQTMIAAELEADKVRLGANALSQDNIVRNTDRLAMLFGREGHGSFFVARPKYGVRKPVDRVKGDRDVAVVDENLPGDPQELIAKGIFDTSPEVHLNNYLRRKNDAAKQELADSVNDAAVAIDPDQFKTYTQEGVAVAEENWTKGHKQAKFVVIEPNGELYKRIERMQPLANQAARRLREDGYHEQADNITESANQMFKSAGDGDFSLGDMIGDPKLRGEIENTRYMVPREMYEAIRNETDNSTKALSSFLQAASTGFKISVLHGRWPAWVLNNTIGAQLYLALTGGAGRMIPHAGGGHLVKEFFPDVSGASSREMASGADDLGRVASNWKEKALDTKAGRIGSDVINTLGDWNQKIADEPARLARLQQVVEDRFQSTVQLAKARGMEIPDTLESRRRMLQDQTVREDIAQEVLDDMIDFTTLSRNERMWVSNVIPFWSFIKGSTKSTMRTLADHPGRVWPLQELGSFGADITDQTYEHGSPEYLRALLPVRDGKALSVGGWNPYSQQSSLFSFGTTVAGGNMPTGQEHPFSMFNPAITIPLEAINKRDTYTQYPLEGNIAQIIGSGMWESFPLGESFLNMINPKQPTGREVFPPSRTNTMLNFAGIPVRDVNEQNMNVRMQADENRRKKNGTYDYWRFHNGV